MTDIATVLDALLHRDPSPGVIGSVDEWWDAHLQATVGEPCPAHAAALGGFASDRIAYAFASGYVEAMRQLLGDPAPARRALCATEAGGGHPRAIECALRLDPDGGGRLDGDKSFVTLGEHATELLVVATTGPDASGRAQLRVARIPADRAGVTIVPVPDLGFVPEIPHARVELRGAEVRPGELLPGDGYVGVLKPFRTIEDTHVHLGLLGLLVRLGRAHDWDDATIEATLALLTTFEPLARSRAPLSVGLHRALGAALASVRAHIEELERGDDWKRLPEPVRQRWVRDRQLLGLAGMVRARRLETARAASR